MAVLLLALEVLLHAGPLGGHGPRAPTQIAIKVEGALPKGSIDQAPELWASEGQFGPATRLPGGRFVAPYTPTPDTYPRVVLLRASVADGGERRLGWLALPLSGSDELALRTKPETQVQVTLGGRAFGPVGSDARGNARIHVVVPPGVRLATVSMRDAFGNASSRDVDLTPPPFPCVAAVAERADAGADDPAPLSIEVFAVKPTGRPAARADLKASAARGTVSFEGARRPGVFLFSYRAPKDGGGADTVSFRAFGSGEALRISVRPPVAPSPVLIAEPSVALAGSSAAPAAGPAPAAGSPSPDADHAAAATLPPPGGPSPLVRRADAAAGSGDPLALAVGLLLRGQSNLSRAHAGGAAIELAGTLPHAAFAPRSLERLEGIARFEGFQFATQSQPGADTGDPLRRGTLQAFSLTAGLRATLLSAGLARVHAAALAGALRSFQTVRVVGGPADGVQQHGARWGPVAAAAAGLSMPLGRGRALAEAQLAFAPARGAIQGNLGGLSLSAGYLFDLN